jgi:hypothetical protein
VDLQKSLYFRDRFRAARAAALKDAEGFQSVLFCLESMGIHLSGRLEGLDSYRAQITQVAARSPLASYVPTVFASWHSSFESMYESLRMARNDAVHQGAYARILTRHAVELCLILEDALMEKATKVHHFMVRDPVCAALWQPVSFVRQQMLVNSFSYIPMYWEPKRSWRFVAECGVAHFLRSASSERERKRRLATAVSNAISNLNLQLIEAETVQYDADIQSVLEKIQERPLLVVNGNGPENLVGILAASDIL